MANLERDFVHLDVSTSFTPGALGNPEGYVLAARKRGMHAIGVADERNINAWGDLNRACRRNDIKPIFGVTFFPHLGLLDQAGQRMVLLVESKEGFHSIYRLLEIQDKRDLEPDDIKDHSQGLVACVPSASFGQFAEIFGVHELFIETSNFGDAAGRGRMEEDLKIAKEQRAPIIAGNRVWHVGLGEGYNQILSLVLRARARRLRLPGRIAEGNNLSLDHPLYNLLQAMTNAGELDPSLLPFHPQGWLKPPDMMRSLFRYREDICDQTVELGRSLIPKSLPRPALPSYPVPEGRSTHDLLKERCEEKLKGRYREVTDKLKERLDYELRIIGERGLSDYFLIVADIAGFCEREGIFNIGVGSATGSLVSYLLRISQVEPLENDLLFERFVGARTDRIPDIDMWVDAQRREEIVKYLYTQLPPRGIYLSRISIFPTFQIRGAIKEVLRAFGYQDQEITRIQQLIAKGENLPLQVKPLVEVASDLSQRGTRTGGVSTHGSKIIFARDPIDGFYPVKQTPEGQSLALIDKSTVDEEAIANVDLIGSYPLTLINNVLNEAGLEIDMIPKNDCETLRMIFSGDTIGVPYLETPWLVEILSRFGVVSGAENLSRRDLVLAFALSRPGVSKSLDTFLRRLGGQQVSYPHPIVEEVLHDTYGLPIFQEQVIMLAKKLAGFSPLEADELRRAMTKERDDTRMEALKDRFIERTVANGISNRVAHELFSQIAQFVKYGFLKGHAVALMDIAYIAAYLKIHYPKEYFRELFKLGRGFYRLTGHPEVYDKEARKFGHNAR